MASQETPPTEPEQILSKTWSQTMSAVFLILSRSEPSKFGATTPSATYLPFVPETSQHLVSEDNHTALYTWSVVDEGARGGYSHTEAGATLAFSGSVVEPRDAPFSNTVAHNLLREVERVGLEPFAWEMDGDWALVHLDTHGVARGVTDYLGACHLYYGTLHGTSVISNRALVAAAALHHGVLPNFDLIETSTLMSSFTSMLGYETIWPNLKLLKPDHIVRISRGRLSLKRFSNIEPTPRLTWQEVSSEMERRCRQIARTPDLPFELTLTGGKDSRAVLAGLISAGVLPQITTCYLNGEPSLADAIVGRALASHYRLPFEMRPFTHEKDDIELSYRQHNFQVEIALNAWDRKGAVQRRRVGDIRGYYGECYKDFDRTLFGLGWSYVIRQFTKSGFVDPFNVMTPTTRMHIANRLRRWITEQRENGVKPTQMKTALHRDTRMRRWVGQAQLSDTCGAPAYNPLSSRRLTRLYNTMTPTMKRQKWIHFEMIHSLDDYLWRQPFAGDRWSRRLLLRRGLRPTRLIADPQFSLCHQLKEWKRHQVRLIELVLTQNVHDDFFECFDRKGIEAHIASVKAKPKPKGLQLLMGLVGVRLAALEGVVPSPFTVALEAPTRPHR